MRTVLVYIFSRIGAWLCAKSISLANSGHLDFEVSCPCEPPYYIKQHKKRKSGLCKSALMVFVAIGISIWAVWSVLTISSAIENSCHKLTEELRIEHKKEIQIFQQKDSGFCISY